MALVHQPLQPSFKQTFYSNGMTSQLGLGCQAGKDSRWLTLEVCREYARNKCTRSEDECRFAHPPPNVEVQNGRVMCCFDSIKGRCQRTEPPCKYLHPPQHLKEQLLQNGRNNLLLKNLQWHSLSSATSIHPIVPTATVYPMAGGYLIQQTPAGYAPYYTQPNGLMPSIIPAIDQCSSSNIPVSTNGCLIPPPALTPPEQQQPVTSVCHSNDMTSQVNGTTTSCPPALPPPVTNCQSYWQPVTAPGPSLTSSNTPAYMVDSQTGTTYYSPTGFFQGVNTPSGLLSVMKSPTQQTPTAVTTKNGLTVYTPCAPPPPPNYQPLALASMQSCYPMIMGTSPVGQTGQPTPVVTGPMRIY